MTVPLLHPHSRLAFIGELDAGGCPLVYKPERPGNFLRKAPSVISKIYRGVLARAINHNNAFDQLAALDCERIPVAPLHMPHTQASCGHLLNGEFHFSQPHPGSVAVLCYEDDAQSFQDRAHCGDIIRKPGCGAVAGLHPAQCRDGNPRQIR